MLIWQLWYMCQTHLKTNLDFSMVSYKIPQMEMWKLWKCYIVVTLLVFQTINLWYCQLHKYQAFIIVCEYKL